MINLIIESLLDPPPPLDTEEPSATLVLPYNSSFNQFQRIMKFFLNTKLVFKYNNTISRSIAKMSPAPLEAEGGVYSVPFSECSDKYDSRDYRYRIFQYQDISA